MSQKHIFPTKQAGRMTPKTANQIIVLESIGAIFIIVTGACLHFIFEWSGHSRLVAVFGAVNESTWEHLKMVFWPAIAFALIEFCLLGLKLPNLGLAKSVSVLVMMAIIVIGAVGIDVVFQQHFLLVDVTLFVVAIFVGQFISWRLNRCQTTPSYLNRLGIAFLLVLVTAFAVFTFSPPTIPLFQDPITKYHGIAAMID